MASLLSVAVRRHQCMSKVTWWTLSHSRPVSQGLTGASTTPPAKKSARSSNSSEERPSPIDLLISRLSVQAQNRSRTIKPRQVTTSRNAELAARVNDGGARRTPTASLIIRKAVYDRQCDAIVMEYVKQEDMDGALAAIQKFAPKNLLPANKTLLAIVCTCSAAGRVHGVRVIKDVSARKSRSTSEAAEHVTLPMDCRHYEAEAIWRRGGYVEALAIFLELLERYPSHRRKLINLSAFCLRDIVDAERLSVSEVHAAAMDFVDTCARQLSTLVPAANLWRAAFFSDSYVAQCLAQTLLDRHGAPLHQSVAIKIPAIVEQARTSLRPDVLQRLMQMLLSLDMKDYYAPVMGAYVNYLCDLEDVSGAREALRFMNRLSIYVDSAAAHRLIVLLVSHGKLGSRQRRMPTSQSKLSSDDVPTCEYRF